MAAKHNRRRFTGQQKRDIIDRIREWQLMPSDSGIPCTQKELAQELGITPAYVCQILSRTPASVLDSLVEGDTEALTMHRRIVRLIAEKAAEGGYKSQKLYLELISQPCRVPKKRESTRMPEIVKRAMELTPTAQIARKRREPRAAGVTDESELTPTKILAMLRDDQDRKPN